MLNGGGAELRADACKQPFTLGARIVEHADLDELVRREVHVDLVEHARREPVLTDADDRVQVMRLRAEGAPRRGC